MPIYEYECHKCGKRFEEIVMNADDEKDIVCPKCRGSRVTRLFSAFGFKSGSKVVSSVSKSGDSCRTCTSKSCDTCG